MGIILVWIIFSLIVGAIGSGRKIGFAGAFFLSLLLSPLIGLIMTILSKDKSDEKYKQDVLASQKQQQIALSEIQAKSKAANRNTITSIVDDLNKLKEMKDDGLLNDEEFQKAKERLLHNYNAKTGSNMDND